MKFSKILNPYVPSRYTNGNPPATAPHTSSPQASAQAYGYNDHRYQQQQYQASPYGATSTPYTSSATSSSTANVGGSSAPKKYVRTNGVMKMNPEYKRWKESQTHKPATTVSSPSQALPVVTNMQDHEELNRIIVQGGGTELPLAESTDATIEMMQEPEISLAAGMEADTMVDELGAVLNKYEVPMGLMNKLMMLTEYRSLEFIIDDSGSMSITSDTVDPITRRSQTRWMEACNRLKEMLEVLAYVPFNMIEISFLNRPDRVQLQRNGRDPRTFLADAHAKVDAVFSRSGPSGTTPAMERLQDSFIRGSGANVARYFFGDGVPNGGARAKEEIRKMCVHRENPSGNPLTFISCTGDDAAVEWMKDVEEIAPFCSEADDFDDEMREVLRDQGEALPFTKGFHLVCQLVAAMNPDDLDAMDESVPFTKSTLDNMLGVVNNPESYRHYFTCFERAQRKRSIHEASDRLKRDVRWNFNDFVTAPVAKQIPAVRDFQARLFRMQ